MKKICLKILSLNLFFIISTPALAFTIIAHRGLPRLYPEHSLTGLKAVLKYNIDFVEPDIVLSKDGIPVVLHDIHLDTTTNIANIYPKRKRQDGRYYAIDFKLKELKKLNINHRINLRTNRAAIASRTPLKNSTLQIPTLDEFINIVLKHNKINNENIGIYPEIKAPHFHQEEGFDSTKIIHDTLLSYHVSNPSFKIIIQCFSSRTLKRLAKERTPFSLVQLIGENSWHRTPDNYKKMQTRKGLEEIAQYANGVAPWINHLYDRRTKGHTNFITFAKENDLFIHPYTVRNDSLPQFIKSEEQILYFLTSAGVDGVFTDNAHTTIEAVAKK